MPKLVTGMQSNQPQTNRGFTLIEILVVVLIIGITIGLALLAFGDFGGQRRIVMAAEHFINYVKLVQQQAILETSTLGIQLNQNTYQALRFQTNSQWQSMPSKGIFHQQQFPKNTVVHLEKMSFKVNTPQLIINASGDMTPFKLNIGSETQPSIVTILGKRNGTVELQPLKSP